jgi:hypothetical protein
MRKKAFYEPPVSQGIWVQVEGVVCGSVNKNFNTPDNTSYDSFAPITGVDITFGDWVL